MKRYDDRQRDPRKEVDVMDLNDRPRNSGKRKNSNNIKQNNKSGNYNSQKSNSKKSNTQNTRSVNSAPRGARTKVKIKNLNKEFTIITYVFLALFMCLTIYLMYYVQFVSEDFMNNPYNARLDHLSETTIKGDIISSDGEILATTNVDQNGYESRVYPHGDMYAHVVGYSANGMSGIEKDANYNMLRSNSFFLTKIVNEIAGKKNQGDTVVSTVDSRLQSAAYNALGNNKGAIICIEPSTGKVLAMVSKPDFDPNSIEANWDEYISDDESSVLLNRTTQGLYAPGSTFKMVTLMAYMDQYKDYDDFYYDCNGEYNLSDHSMHCYNNKAHGPENLLDAFGNSCNCAFSEIGLKLNINGYGKLCDDLLFNTELPTNLSNTTTSRFSLNADDSDSTIAQTAIGQGQTMVSPIHMAMLASAIANDGLLMKPYVIDHVQNDQGHVVKNYKSQAYGQLIDGNTAAKMDEYMRYVVTNGTASSLMSDQYCAYGKTGTADFSSDMDKNHSWFVGYAENYYGKEIAVAVIVEEVPSGSPYAVPATKEILDTYFSY